jgi:hypothetical protein
MLVLNQVSIGNFQKRRLQYHQMGDKDNFSALSAAHGKCGWVASYCGDRET